MAFQLTRANRTPHSGQYRPRQRDSRKWHLRRKRIHSRITPYSRWLIRPFSVRNNRLVLGIAIAMAKVCPPNR